MQGSFTSESADKFLQLMREAGYEVSKTVSDSKLKNFSELSINPGAVQGDVWSGNFANFGEVRGEYIENYDYTRCVRPDGSAYGTKGKCRKGKESAAEELKKLRRFERVSSDSLVAPVPPKPIKDPVPGILRSQAEVKKIIADKPETPNPIRNAMGQPLNLTADRVKALSDKDLESEWNRAKTKGRKDKLQAELDRREAASKEAETTGGPVASARNLNKIDAQLKELKAQLRGATTAKQIAIFGSRIQELQGKLDKARGENFSELPYDFTRCVRPDGSAYGTKGKCRKGTEQAKEVPSLKAKPQPKVKPQPKAKPQPHPEVEPNPKESYSSLMNQQLSLVIKGDLKGAMALSDKINEARDKYTKTPEAMAQQKKIEEEAVKKLSSRDAEKAAKDARDNAQLNAKLTAKDKKSPQ